MKKTNVGSVRHCHYSGDEMAKEDTDKSRDSVNVALQDLLGVEDARQESEEQKNKQLEEEARQRAEEEEHLRAEEEEQKQREQEEAKLAEERALIEEHERKERDQEERKIKIKLETEAKRRVEDQGRLLDHELQIKRLDAKKKKLPVWVYALIAGILIIGGGAWYYSFQQTKARDAAVRQAAMEELEELRKELSQKDKEIQVAAKALEDALAANDAVAIKNARKALANAEAKAKEKPKTVPRTPPKGSANKEDSIFTSDEGLSSNPTEGLKDDLPLLKKRPKKRPTKRPKDQPTDQPKDPSDTLF
jgi:colicin import membrane protein